MEHYFTTNFTRNFTRHLRGVPVENFTTRSAENFTRRPGRHITMAAPVPSIPPVGKATEMAGVKAGPRGSQGVEGGNWGQ